MNVEWSPPQILNERLDIAQRLPQHVSINLVPGDLLRPVSAFLNEKLPKYSMCVKRNDPRHHAESTIARDNLPHPMKRPRHVQQ